MAETFNLELPDGRIVEGIPVGTSKAEIAAKLGIAEAPAKSKLENFVETGKEVGRVADMSIRGGLLAIPQLFSAVASVPAWAGRKAAEALTGKELPPNKAPWAPENMADMLESATGGEVSRPQTTAGKYAGALGQGIVSSLLPGSQASMLKAAVTGGSAGLGSEAASQFMGDETNPLLRIGGSLLGGLAGGTLGSVALLNTKDLAREALRDARKPDLERAIKEAEAANAAGVSTIPQQHMPTGTNLDAYVEALAQHPAGEKVTSTLRKQPAEVSLLAEEMLADIPGKVELPHVAANQVQDAATSVLNNLKEIRTEGWKKVFDEVSDQLGTGGQLTPSTVENVQKFLQKTASKLPNSEKAAWLNNLSQKLSTTRMVGGKQVTEPITDVEAVNTLLREASDGLKQANLATSGVKTGSTKFLGGKLQAVRDKLGEEFVPLKEADAWYKQYTDNVYNAVKNGVIGRVAGRLGSLPDKEAVVSHIFSVFDKGTLPGAQTSEIRTLAQEFRKVGESQAFNDAFKTWMVTGIDKALKTETPRLPEDIAHRLSAYFGGMTTNTAKSQGLRDGLAELATNMGMTDKQAATYIRGVENTMKIFNAAAVRPASVSGANRKDIIDAAGSGIGRRLGQLSIMTPLRQPLLAWSSFVEHNSLKAIDSLLTSPEGMRTMMEIGKQTPMSQLSVNALSTLLESAAAANSTDN